MTRDEQLVFCKQCTNRKLDLKQGLLCGLTEKMADFQNECKDFIEDTTVQPPKFTTHGSTENGSVIPTADDVNIVIPEAVVERLKAEQNLNLGIAGSVAAGIVLAILWGMITVATNYQIGFMAIAVGAGVGLVMRGIGKGVEPVYGIAGAAIAFFSVVLGNFFSIIGFIANAEGLGYTETLGLIDYAYVPEIMLETFSFMDIVFYGIAIYEGYRFSFRLVSEEDIARLS